MLCFIYSIHVIRYIINYYYRITYYNTGVKRVIHSTFLLNMNR